MNSTNPLRFTSRMLLIAFFLFLLLVLPLLASTAQAAPLRRGPATHAAIAQPPPKASHTPSTPPPRSRAPARHSRPGPTFILAYPTSGPLAQRPIVASTHIPNASASYLYADAGSGSANSIDVFKIGLNGSLTLIQEIQTGGVVARAALGANNIAISKKAPCLFHVDNGTNEVESFGINTSTGILTPVNAVTGIGNAANGSYAGDIHVIGKNVWVAVWNLSGPSQLVSLAISKTCALSLGQTFTTPGNELYYTLVPLSSARLAAVDYNNSAIDVYSLVNLSGQEAISLVSHTPTQLSSVEGGAYGVIGSTGYLFNGAAASPPQAEAHTISADDAQGFVPGSPATGNAQGSIGANLFFDPSHQYVIQSGNTGGTVATYGLVNGAFTFLKTNALYGSFGSTAQTEFGNEYFVESYKSPSVNACAIQSQGVLKCNLPVPLHNASAPDGIGVYPPLPTPPAPPLAPPLTGRERLGGFNPSELNHALSSAGNQVDTLTGDYSPSYQDLSIPARGFPLLFTRTYNSQAASFNGPLGWGWTDSYHFVLGGDGSGNIIVQQENDSTVTFTPNGQGGYNAPSQVLATLTYNSGSHIFTFTRKQGQTHYLFNLSGQLIQEVDRNGYHTSLTYQNGKLMTVTDATAAPNSRSLTFSYDATNGQISKVTDPMGRIVSFGYNYTTNDLTSVIDVNGGTTSFTYDNHHTLLTITDPNGGVFTNVYDSSSRAASQTDALARTTTLNYGSNHVTTITDPNLNVTVDSYTNALLTSQVNGYGSQQQAAWSYQYNSGPFGATMITDPNGGIWQYTWDANGNRLSSTDPLGRVKTYTYDGMNDILQAIYLPGEMTTYTYDTNGNVLSKSHQLGSNQFQTTSFIYGSGFAGDVTEVIQPNQQVIKKRLHCDSNPTHMHPWCYTYDTYGNRLIASDPLLDTTMYAYNGIGWKMSQTSPNGYQTLYSYDSFGDVLTVTDPLTHTTTNVYDANRNLVQVTDANNNTTQYTYDADNERTQVKRADMTILKYSYDKDGNQIAQTDGLNHTTTYAYGDPAYPGKVTATTDQNNELTTYTYDGNGNRLSLTDPAGKLTSYSYYADNTLKAISYNLDPQTHDVSFSYDDYGNRLSMTDGTGTTTYAYDLLNRLMSMANGASSTVSYGYDLNNNLISLTYPGTLQVTRTYDATNRLIAVKDWRGNSTTFRYDADGNIVTENYPDGIVGTRQYDMNDRVTSIVNKKGNTTLLGFAYTRNNVELLASLSTQGAPLVNESYSYSALNQVSTVNLYQYQYDAGNNLTQSGNTSLQYDAANEVTSLNNGATTFQYDAKGNRTSQTAPGNVVTSYTYDQANRLTGYSVGSTTATYTYNGDGLRMGKTVGVTSDAFTWDTVEGPALMLQDASTQSKQYIYGPGGIPLEQVSGNTVLYYLSDQLGSTWALANAAGAEVDTYTYDAYGNVTMVTGSDANPLLYAGQYTDAESGLIYLRARYYDPITQQFLTRDPAVAKTQEAYGYAGGDPLNMTDPTGLGRGWRWWLKAIGIGLIIVGVILICIVAPIVAVAIAGTVSSWGAVSLGAGSLLAVASIWL